MKQPYEEIYQELTKLANIKINEGSAFNRAKKWDDAAVALAEAKGLSTAASLILKAELKAFRAECAENQAIMEESREKAIMRGREAMEEMNDFVNNNKNL